MFTMESVPHTTNSAAGTTVEVVNVQDLVNAAQFLNNAAVTLQQQGHCVLAHQTLKDAMHCMQLLIARPLVDVAMPASSSGQQEEGQPSSSPPLAPQQPTITPISSSWPTPQELEFRLQLAAERIRLVQQRQEAHINVPQQQHNCQHPPQWDTAGEDESLSSTYLRLPIPIELPGRNRKEIDINSAIIVFNFGLTYLGLAAAYGKENEPSTAPHKPTVPDRRTLQEAALQLFYVSYTILVKLSVETEQLDFCEYILILMLSMLRQIIRCDAQLGGRYTASLQQLFQHAQDSFATLHQIGQVGTLAAAA